jgi:CBS domain-containing protein
MRLWDVNDALVVHDGQFCGLLTVRAVVVAAIASGRHPATVTARECCDDHPYVSLDEPTDHAADLMARHEPPRLPVLDDGRLVGIIWAADLLALSTT